MVMVTNTDGATKETEMKVQSERASLLWGVGSSAQVTNG